MTIEKLIKEQEEKIRIFGIQLENINDDMREGRRNNLSIGELLFKKRRIGDLRQQLVQFVADLECIEK